MKQFVILAFLVLCSVILQECTANTSNNAEINWITLPAFTDCGGVIPLMHNNGVGSATISYMSGKPLIRNEFCVWTFLAEDTAGDAYINFNSIPTANAGLVVYTWNDSNFTSHRILTGSSSLTLDAQHFAVAFSTNDRIASNGFTFNVRVAKGGNGVTNSKAYFSGQTKGDFTYPKIIGQEKYKNDKRVSVVLHGYTETPRQFIEYSLKDLDTEENHDFVEVYVLKSFENGPVLVGRFSGQESGAVANSDIVTLYPVLYLFSSDRKGAGKGFTITWKVVEGGIDSTEDF